MIITQDNLYNLTGDSVIKRSSFKKSIIPFIMQSSAETSLIRMTGASLGAAMAVKAPTHITGDPISDAVNLIFEIRSTDDASAIMALRLLNIHVAVKLKEVYPGLELYTERDGIIAEETVQDDIVIPSERVAINHVFRLDRSYIIYIGLIPGVYETTDEQTQQVMNSSIEDFYSVIASINQDIVSIIN